MKRSVLALLCGLSVSSSAQALVWPTAVERVQQRIRSADVQVRRRAAQELSRLPKSVARRVTFEALSDSDVEVRLAASEAALQIQLPELGERVIPWLNDPEVRVRRSATKILVERPHPAATSALARVLGDPDADVRESAARALGASGDRSAVVPLLGRLDDDRPEVRRAVIGALSALGDRRAVVPLIGKIQDPRADVRRVVARTLGELGDARAASALVLALRDRDEGVRVTSLQALGDLRAPQATLAIIALMDEDARGAVQAAALDALGQIPAPEAQSALVAALAHRDPQLRHAARQAAVRAGAVLAPRLVECLRGQPDMDLANGCVRVLGRIGGSDARSSILSALRRGVVHAGEASRALGELGDPLSLPAVLEQLSAADPAVRSAAVDAASVLLDPSRPDGRAVEPIARALDAARGHRAERAALAALLGRTGSARALPVLAPFARVSDDVRLRTAAIRALGSIGPAGQDDILLAGLADEQGTVRLAAAVALRQTASGQTAKVLLEQIHRAAEQDRAALLIALPGAMARTTDPEVVQQVEQLLRSDRGGAQDALVEALGAAHGALGSRPLLAFLETPPVDPIRAKIAEALASHPEARSTLRKLSADSNAAVRANAVWALGCTGRAPDIQAVVSNLSDRDVTVAGNAAAALGRMAARGLEVRASLCGALDDSRGYVRANGLAGVALGGQRCDPQRERSLLLRDPQPVVRASAARLLWTASDSSDLDRDALERCAQGDPSGDVAAACATPPPRREAGDEPVLVYVVPAGEYEPVSRAPFALVLADGLMRLGLADRRGAVYEFSAPRGPLELTIPAQLAR